MPRSQVQDSNNKKYSGPVDVAKKVFQEAGIRGLYKVRPRDRGSEAGFSEPPANRAILASDP